MASPLRPSENQNKNLSKKEKQEAFCALPLVGPSRTRQRETAQSLPELGQRLNQFHVLGAAPLGGAEVITRGDTGSPARRRVQNDLSNEERRLPEIPCRSFSSKTRNVTRHKKLGIL